MTQKQKLLDKLLANPTPADFTWKELVRLLKGLGYELSKRRGKTGGARRRFINSKTNKRINMHKPHPDRILKKYVIDDIIESLKDHGAID